MENKCHLTARAACAALAILSCAAQASATTSQAAHDAAVAPPCHAVQEAIDRALAAGQTTITIPKAVYTLPPGKVASIHLQDVKDVTVDFQGAELRGKIRSGMIRLDRCVNVTIKNLAIDYPDCLPFAEGWIRNVGPDGEWDVEIADGYADRAGGWPIQVYDKDTGALVNPMRMGGEKIVRTGPRRFSVTGGRNRKGKVGDVVVWSFGCEAFGSTQSISSRAHAVYLVDCANCRVENVTVYSTPGSNAFREVLGLGGNTYARCSVVPRDAGSDPVARALPRYRSGNHDAFNSRAVKRGPALIGCVARNHCDDDVNIHGPYQYVAAAQGRVARVFVKDMYAGTLKVGDPVQLVTKDGHVPPVQPVIAALRPAEPTPAEIADMKKGLVQQMVESCHTMVEVTFDRECDALKAGSLFVSQNQGGNGFLLRGCRFGPNRARGFICNASDGVVEDCIFDGLEGQAILSRPSYGWLEGGAARNIRIQGCTFIDCGVFFGVHKEMETTPDCHRNIVFSGCRFRGARATLDVRCCRGLTLDGNTFDLPPDKAIRLVHVTDVADVRPVDGNGGKPRVNWNDYLSRMEQPAPKTGVRRFQLDGFPQKVYYDAQSPLERGSGCSLAVVVIHGWGGGFIRSRSQETLIDEFRKMKCFGEDVPYVIAPLFPRDDLAEKKFGKVEGLATWNRSWSKDFRVNLAVPGKAEDDWRGGGDAMGTALSSYDVVDRIFALFGDRRRFPNLKKVVLTGFSAGGQFVGRYAAVGKGNVREGVKIAYAAMAPSTELRLDLEVRWHYGLKGRPRYAATLTEEDIMRNLSSRRVWRGCGSKDVLGRPHTALDSCPEAMAQGANRFDRFRKFESYLTAFPKWSEQVSFHVFEGLGHDSAAAYRDPALIAYMVDGL